ncbi:hypothetical protein [Fulvimarina sp. MAC3]|uniref:hypothetical protein n=1 Tax=Fulvimarina sp. MAC3 TaxID=3148887 RepID=UPI0031FD729A
MTDITPDREHEDDKTLNLGFHAAVLVLVCLLVWVGNTVGPDKPIIAGLIGLAVLYAMVMVALVITKFAPFRLPSVAWISLVGIVLTLPWTPGSEWIVAQVSNVDFLALATPCLAYAGMAIARREIQVAKESGWKLAVIAVLVMIGTYAGSAFIADIFL